MRNDNARQLVGCDSRAGTVLIVTMWVILVLVALVLVFSDSMRIAAAVTANNVAAIEAECLASAAVEYAKANLMTIKEEAEATSLETTTPYDAMKVGTGYFWVLRSNLENDRDFEFGLTDEAGKINLNTATYGMLMKLPNMTEELAASIIDWRDADSDVTTNGAEDDYYMLLPDPYDCKNAPLQTVEEILLIKGGTEQILYGEDTNLNGHLDENENDGDESDPPDNRDSQLDRGIYDYVTVYSAESNLDSEGTARINVKDSAAQADLTTLLTSTFSADKATTIIAAVGSSSNSLVAFFLNAKAGAQMTEAEFNQIADHLTTSSDANVPGLINVNTASKPVLMCFTDPNIGLEETDVDSLISYRQGGSDLSSVAWVTDVLDETKARAIGPYITVHSYQCSTDIVAISGNGRAYRRYKAVIDVSGTTPRVTYWKSMTRFGWPLPETIVTALRKGQPLTKDVLGY
jgi:type II secretory pathway component PulK